MTKNLLRQVRRKIEEYALILPGEHVVVGVSGGPDSMCLLDILSKLATECDFSLSAVHVNHKFRPGEAEKDAAFVAAFCNMRKIPLRVVERDCPKMVEELRMSPEEAGREARYEAFREAVSEIGAPAKIAVAHNKNDQAETVLLHLFRGSGLDGLSGMDFLRKDKRGFTVIRPLLATLREDIEAYCRSEGLAPRTDATNEEVLYRRNRVRNEMLPYLKEHFNPSIVDSLARTSELLSQDRDYLRRETEALASATRKGSTLDREVLRQADPVLRRRVLRECLFAAGLTEDVRQRQIEDADRLLISDASSGSIDFPKGYRFYVSYETAGVRVSQTRKTQGLPDLIVSEGLPQEFAGKKKEGYGFALFDADKLREVITCPAQELAVRFRTSGDFLVIRTKNGFGRKKVQNLFVDRKVPKEERNEIVMIACGHEILWIPGLKGGTVFSAKYAVTENTEKVLCLEIRGQM